MPRCLSPTPEVFRLVATDVDGTLLVDSQITTRTRQALRLAIEAGLKVALVSARAPRSIKWVAENASLDGFAICLNGALIYDLDKEEVVKVWPLNRPTVFRVVEQLRKELPGICFHWEKENGFGREPAYESLAGPLLDHEPPIRVLCDVLEEPDSIAKLVARHPGLESGPLRERAGAVLETDVHVTLSDPRFIEITAEGVTKASALAWLCESLGVRSQEVIAFGDMTNDIEMLSWAGHSVAMGNAPDAVKGAADEVALDAVDDGLAIVLERILDDVH